jgi:hypothetical protein
MVFNSWGLEYVVWSLEFVVKDLGFGVYNFGFMTWCLNVRVWRLEFILHPNSSTKTLNPNPQFQTTNSQTPNIQPSI